MKTQSIDTHPKAEEIQIALLRQATAARRFAIMRSLSQTTIQLSRRAIRRANPSFSQLEVNLAFVAHHYGEELAEQVSQYLKQRRYESI
ncbi:MAG: hypothetical protein GY803_22680 [Chloroflexi bacterium]|nr:hypothetical protein [Chloroflexota bacterium]